MRSIVYFCPASYNSGYARLNSGVMSLSSEYAKNQVKLVHSELYNIGSQSAKYICPENPLKNAKYISVKTSKMLFVKVVAHDPRDTSVAVPAVHEDEGFEEPELTDCVVR